MKKKASERNTEKVPAKKSLTTKQKMIIVIACCATLVILAVALPVGLIFGKADTVPKPYFSDFNDETDYYLRIKWNKIRNAVNYDYIYYYGDPATADENKFVLNTVQNTATNIARQKGTIAFKVRANVIGKKTEFSDWITINASAWKLDSPIVTISDKLDISWTGSIYKSKENTYEVNNYEYEIVVDGKTAVPNGKITAKSVEAKDFLKKYIDDNVDKVKNFAITGDWEDFVVTVRVKAVTYTLFGDVVITEPTGAESVLPKIYEDSDEGTASLVITKEIYMSL